MDSCVTAAIARQTHEVAFVHASYGQRTERRERQAFDAIADFWGVRQRLVVRLDHFAQIGGSALTDSRIAVPEGEPAAAVSASEIPPTYVPFRNAHFLSVAVSWAEVIGASAVFIGAVAEDSSGYPDCRPRFCSNRTRTEQYLCSVRVLQVRTTPSKVEDHVKDGCYLTGKWIQWVSGSIWTSVERSKGETEGRAQKRQEKRRRRPSDHVYHSLRIKL